VLLGKKKKIPSGRVYTFHGNIPFLKNIPVEFVRFVGSREVTQGARSFGFKPFSSRGKF